MLLLYDCIFGGYITIDIRQKAKCRRRVLNKKNVVQLACTVSSVICTDR